MTFDFERQRKVRGQDKPQMTCWNTLTRPEPRLSCCTKDSTKTQQSHRVSSQLLHGTELSKRLQLVHQEKGAFPHSHHAVWIGPLEPVNPSWTPRARASGHQCVVGGWTCHTTPQSLNEKPVSEETMPGGSRARQWKQHQPFLDTLQSQENLKHERSSSIRTQLGGSWQRRFCFGTRGRQQALFFCLQERIQQQEE